MDTKLSETKQLILTMVKGIVSLPEQVELNISEESDEKGEYTQINVKVAKSDIPRTIGKKGETAEAIRRIAVLSAIKQGYRKMVFLRVDAPRMPDNHFYKGETAAPVAQAA